MEIDVRKEKKKWSQIKMQMEKELFNIQMLKHCTGKCKFFFFFSLSFLRQMKSNGSLCITDLLDLKMEFSHDSRFKSRHNFIFSTFFIARRQNF